MNREAIEELIEREGDAADWIDGRTGLSCSAGRNSLGAWCGYVHVRVLPMERLEPGWESSLYYRWSVHGGITWIEWHHRSLVLVLGFDCAHAGDYVPSLPANHPTSYRTLEYVKMQCSQLAAQVLDSYVDDLIWLPQRNYWMTEVIE